MVEADWYSALWDDYTAYIGIKKDGWILGRDSNYPPGTSDCDFDTFEEARNRALKENDGCIYIVAEVNSHMDLIDLVSQYERPLKKYTVLRYAARGSWNPKNRKWFFENFDDVIKKARLLPLSQQSIMKISNYTVVCK